MKVLHLSSVVKSFVYSENDTESDSSTSKAVKSFAAESESVIYLEPSVLRSDKDLFREFHDYTVLLGQPMATVIVSNEEKCRQCSKNLLVDNKTHPIVIYSAHRGTYLGSRITKYCRNCKLYEHYGYYTSGSNKHYSEDALQLDYLLSTEDTAFEMTFLQDYANLLFLGALPFSTYAASYNRRFGYYQTSNADGRPKVKRMKK